MHAISSYRGNRPTNKQTNKGDYNTLRRSFASTQCKNSLCHVVGGSVVISDSAGIVAKGKQRTSYGQYLLKLASLLELTYYLARQNRAHTQRCAVCVNYEIVQLYMYICACRARQKSNQLKNFFF